jgi:hypothetical protein
MDFQYVNSLWPKTTSDVPNIWCIINSLRIFEQHVLGCIDLRQAFYVIRLFNVHFHLVTGVGEFYSQRMCFGTSVGPGQLDQSLNLIFKKLWKYFMFSLLCRFVDDVGISGTCQSVPANLRLLIGALRLCGFEVQNKKFTITSSPATADQLVKALMSYSLPSLLSPAVKILGVSLSYTADQMRLSCGRAGRIAEAQKLVLSAKSTGFTKKSLFTLCGLIGFDPARLHPETRCIADSIRSIIGSSFSSIPWDQKIELGELSSDEQVAMTNLLVWIGEIALTCDHRSTTCITECEKHFQLFSDASVSGGGFVLMCNGSEVCREGYRWKGPQTRYHINRLELLALVKAVQPAADLIEFLTEHSVTPFKCKLDVFCDNKASVCWVRDSEAENLKKLPSIRKAMDRKALMSLASSLTDEFEALRVSGIPVRLAHVEGARNQADVVSRLFEQKCTNGKTLAMILNKSSVTSQTSSDGNPSQWSLIDNTSVKPPADFVRRVRTSLADKPPTIISLTDRWAKHCWSPEQVYGLARATRFILKILRANAVKGQFPVTYPDVESSDFLATVRSCQWSDAALSSCFQDTIQRKKICVGPVVFSLEHQLLLFKSGLPNGTVVWQYLIPKSSNFFRAILIRHAHRQILHSGPNQTLAVVNSWGFHLPGGMMSTRSVLNSCYPCKVNNTLRSFTGSIGHGCELDDLVKMEPYHTVAADYIQLGERTAVLAVTCHMSKHTTWLLAKNETTVEAVKLLQQVQVEQGGVRKIHVDRASYFRSDEFSSQCLSKLGATVVYVPTGAPWESLVEKIYDLGQRRLRMALRYLSGHVSKLDELELQRLLNYVCFLLNTRPVCQFSTVADSGVTEPITPDMLRYGYTRKLGSFSSTLADCKLNLSASQREVRSTFLDLFWKELKAKSAKACASKGRRTAQYGLPFSPGQSVLVYSAAKVKLGHTFVLAHVCSMTSETHVRVVFCDGKTSVENINNVHLINSDDAQVQYGPSLVGATVEVLFTMKDGSVKWFTGQVTKLCFDGSVLIKWLNGDRATAIDLWHPSISWRYSQSA